MLATLLAIALAQSQPAYVAGNGSGLIAVGMRSGAYLCFDWPTCSKTVALSGGVITFNGSIVASNLSGTNTGDVTLTAVGSSPSANGASLSGQVLTLQPADATHPGLLTALSQGIGGTKTFSLAPSAPSYTATAGGLTGTANINSAPFIQLTPSQASHSNSGYTFRVNAAPATQGNGGFFYDDMCVAPDDACFAFGYNRDGAKATEPEFFQQLETNYEPGGGVHQSELYYQYVSIDRLTTLRPWGVAVNRATNSSSQSFDAATTSFQSDDGSVNYMQIQSSAIHLERDTSIDSGYSITTQGGASTSDFGANGASGTFGTPSGIATFRGSANNFSGPVNANAGVDHDAAHQNTLTLALTNANFIELRRHAGIGNVTSLPSAADATQYNTLWFPNYGAVLPEDAAASAGIYLGSNLCHASGSNWDVCDGTKPQWRLSLQHGSSVDAFGLWRSATGGYNEKQLLKIDNTGAWTVKDVAGTTQWSVSAGGVITNKGIAATGDVAATATLTAPALRSASAGNVNLTVNAAGSGTIGIGTASTGLITIGEPTLLYNSNAGGYSQLKIREGDTQGSNIDLLIQANDNTTTRFAVYPTAVDVGTGLDVTGGTTLNGDVTLGDATSDTLTAWPATLAFSKASNHTIVVNASTAFNTAGGNLTLQAGAPAGVGTGGTLTLEGGAPGAGTPGAIVVGGGATGIALNSPVTLNSSFVSPSSSVGIGTSSVPNLLTLRAAATPLTATMQLAHGAGDYGLLVKRTVADNGYSNITFVKSRGDTATALAAGDGIGRLLFQAVTVGGGSPTVQEVAEMGVKNTLFSGGNADGAFYLQTKTQTGSLTDRLTIGAAGDVAIIGDASADNHIEFGQVADDTSNVYIDMRNNTYSDFSLRILRGSGANGASQFLSHGSGTMTIGTLESGSIVIETGGTAGVSIDTSQNVTTGGGLTIGSSGTSISKSVATTATVDVANVTAQTQVDTSVSLTGAAAGSPCVVGVAGTRPANTSGIVFTCRVSATGTVQLEAFNVTAGALDPASGSYQFRVFNP